MTWPMTSNYLQNQQKKLHLRSKMPVVKQKLSVAEKYGMVMLLHHTMQIINHHSAIEFATNFLGISALGIDDGELLVKRYWRHRLVQELDLQPVCQQPCLSPSPMSINDTGLLGKKKKATFSKYTTRLNVVLDLPVDKGLDGIVVSHTKTFKKEIKREKNEFFL